MGPKVDPVASDTMLPERVDVVVIGGGIAGVSATWALAQKGISVALCEKGEIAGEQSSRNWGWCRKMGRDPREIPLIIESMRLWQGMNEAVGAETGFRTTGIAYLCVDDADVARREKWLEYSRPFQLDTQLIGADEVAALYPQAKTRFKAALYTKSDGRAEPQKAGPAIAKAARLAGARILTNCAVRGLEQQGGRISGVVTEKGRIACGSVLLAGGAWSRLFCGNQGVALPQLKVRSSVLRTEPLDNGPEVAASGGGFAFRKRLDGGYTIANLNASVTEIVPDSFLLGLRFMRLWRSGQATVKLRLSERFLEEARHKRRWKMDETTPFELTRTLDPYPLEKVNNQALGKLRAAFPMFEQARVAQQWAGMIDVTPDAVPVISPVESVPGFFVATGFSGHGFGIGPGAGRLAADLVSGDNPVVDPTPFRLQRFLDGSPTQVMEGV